MVQATLRQINPKTATRRAVKGFIPDDAIWGYTMFTPKGCISCRGTFVDGYGEKFFKLRYCQGDILYVRETYCPDYFDFVTQYGNRNAYKADYDKAVLSSDIAEPKWTPSIHMPKETARIWLKVTDVRVERLQDITNEQILKEGVNKNAIERYIKQIPEETEELIRAAFLMEWQQVWNSTTKKKDLDLYGWEANPWVWVIEFERCEKPD